MTTRRRMVYELAEVDKRRSKQEVAQEGGKAGGRGRGDSLAQSCAKQKEHGAHKSAAATAAVVVTRAAQLGLNDPAWAKLRETAAFVLELQKNREAIGRDSELRPEGAF